MALALGKKLAVLVILVGVVSIALGGVFISQSISKSSLITAAMLEEKVAYAAAGGAIEGIVDTPQEAQAMAGILKEHRFTNYGSYTELKKDDPKRDQILKAMTMENSLNMAQLGFGLTDVVKISGGWMVLVGLGFAATGAASFRKKD